MDKKEPSDSLREKIENSQRKLENQMRPEIEVSDKTSPKEEEKWLSDSGLFLQGGLLSNLLLPSGGVWPFAAGGYLFDFGLFVKGEVLAPFATASLSVGWELLDGVLRPFPWFQAGYAFVRSLKDDTSGGWVMSMCAGLRWLPWSENGFWFGARAGIAFDLERERKAIPFLCHLAWGTAYEMVCLLCTCSELRTQSIFK
ncbi:MAG: hypothetical protein IPJ88_01855 [Myxococcales bacterium]|nr:MAG: hypothetical protein IPJ88_01855 [Myxococcales bacterium]